MAVPGRTGLSKLPARTEHTAYSPFLVPYLGGFCIKLKLAILTMAFFAIGTQQAEAHMLKHPKKVSQLTYAQRLEHHGTTGVRWLKKWHKLLIVSFSMDQQQWSQSVKAHRWLAKYGRQLKIHACEHLLSLRWQSARTQQICWNLVLPRHYFSWIGIHSCEGAWTDDDDPYWGGLQMDRGFMYNYAPAWLLRKGFANQWTPLEQMWVAERGLAVQGFGAWPVCQHSK